MADPRLPCRAPEPACPPAHAVFNDQPSRFIRLEREVEEDYRPQMLDALQRKVNAVAEEAQAKAPACPQCGPWAITTRERFPGRRAADAYTPMCRATVARPANNCAGLCWICWAGAKEHVAVLSHGLWMRRFGGDAQVMRRLSNAPRASMR